MTALPGHLLASEAGGPPAFLSPLVALLVAAAAIGYLCVRLRVVPIVGFLLAGVLIGPNALGVVRDLEVVEAAAEVGVILLLFSIGIEFSLERLARIRRLVLLGGSAQVLGAVGLVTGVLVLLDVEPRQAVFTGFLVALSSTAIVLKLLGDRGQTSSRTGQAGLALLVFQDLAVVGMVLLLPVLGGGDGSGGRQLAQALGTAVGVIVLVLVVARRLMPRVLEAVARACSPEVFLLSVIAICLGTATLTAQAGVSVSLGAFLAGLVVSESRHSAHALGEILPLQILFSATFFLSVGTLLDVRFLLREPLLVLGAVALVLVVKTVTTLAAARLVGLPLATAASLALLLAQVGEFAFVLERAGREQGLTPAGLGADGSQAFIASTVLLLVATPALAAAGRSLASRLETRRSRSAAGAPQVPLDEPLAGGHVLVSGWPYGPRGRRRAAGARRPRRGGHAVPGRCGRGRGRRARRRPRRLHQVLGAPAGPDRRGAAGRHRRRRARPGGAHRRRRRDRGAGAAGRRARAPGWGRADLAAAGVTQVVVADRASSLAVTAAVRTALRTEPPRGPTVPDTSMVVAFRADPDNDCAHTSLARPVVPRSPGCEQCLREGATWVHLRLCVTCGHVGCCESSPGRHAGAHARGEDGHVLIASLEPGEDWGWCYSDQTTLAPDLTVVRAGR